MEDHDSGRWAARFPAHDSCDLGIGLLKEESKVSAE